MERFSDEYIKEQKEKFIDEFFEKEIKSFPGEHGVDSQYVEVRYVPTRPELRRSIFSKYNRFRFNMDWDEYISIVMLAVSSTVIEYEPKDKDYDWSKLNEIGSKSHLQLSKFVEMLIDSRLSDANRAAEHKKPTSVRVKENGKTVRKTALVDTKPDSTDAIVKQEDGETNLIQALGTKSQYGYQHSLYHPNHFLHYFYQNRHNPKNFLTNKQKEYIEVQQKFLHEDGSDYTRPYKHDSTQPYKERNRLQYIQTIRNRITKFYDEAHSDAEEITLLQMKKEADLLLLNELITLVYDVEYINVWALNESISEWVYEQLNNARNTILSDLLHDELTVSELIHMNRSLNNNYSINNKLIYKIVRLVENKIQQLKKFDTSKSDDKLRRTSRWTKKDHIKYQAYYDDFTKTTTKVYDIRTGDLIRAEKYVPEKKKVVIQKLNTNGLRHEVDEYDVGIN